VANVARQAALPSAALPLPWLIGIGAVI